MKNIFKIALLLMMGFLYSCSSNDSSSTDPQVVNPTNVQTTAVIDTWRITNFMDGTRNETSNYTGYVFTFLANGSATAVKNSITTNAN